MKITARCNDCEKIFEGDFDDDIEFLEYENGLPLSCCDDCTDKLIEEIMVDAKEDPEIIKLFP